MRERSGYILTDSFGTDDTTHLTTTQANDGGSTFRRHSNFGKTPKNPDMEISSLQATPHNQCMCPTHVVYLESFSVTPSCLIQTSQAF